MLRRLAVLALVPVLVLAGCVPSRPEVDPDTGAGLSEATAWFEGLSAEEQLKVAAQQDATAERALWKVVGLDEALGGEKAADETFGAMQDAVAALIDSLRDDGVAFEPAAFVQGTGFDDAVGAGGFGNMMLGDLLNQAGMDRTKDGTEGSDTTDLSPDTQATMSSGDGKVTTEYHTEKTIKGVKLRLQIKSEITPCPDADGTVHAEGTYTLEVSAPDGHGLYSEVTVKADIQVDDDAKPAGKQYEYYVEYSDTKSGAGIIAYRVGADSTTEFGSGGDAPAKARSDAIANGGFFAVWMANSLQNAAQKGWEDGRCIQMNVSYSDGPGGLDPNTKVTLTVSPIAKKDGAPAGGTVTAKLSSGKEAVSPSGEKVKADATFTYTAPGERDKDGTVHLEARSKRGVGILDATLDTKAKAYIIEGGGGDLSFSGQTCDIGKPFSISGQGITIAFTPSSTAGGSYTFTGFAGGTWSGGGSYTTTFTSGGGTITTNGTHTVSTPVGSFTKPGLMYLTLTPITC